LPTKKDIIQNILDLVHLKAGLKLFPKQMRTSDYVQLQLLN